MSNLLSELEALTDKFRHDPYVSGAEQVEIARRINAIKAKIAADAKDAARYRWLRDHQFSFTHDQHERGIASTRWGEWIDVDDAETLDLCIDTVMRDGSDHDRKVAAMSAREGE